MQGPKATSKGQTTLPTAVRAALKIDAGDTLRYIVSGGEVRILKARSVAELSGTLKRPKSSARICRGDGWSHCWRLHVLTMSIALDTNVLVRFLTQNDTEQFEIAQNVINNCSAKQPAFNCREVLVKLFLGSWAFLQILLKWNYGSRNGIGVCSWTTGRDSIGCCWDLTSLPEWRFWIFQFDDPSSCEAYGCHPNRDQLLNQYAPTLDVEFSLVNTHLEVLQIFPRVLSYGS